MFGLYALTALFAHYADYTCAVFNSDTGQCCLRVCSYCVVAVMFGRRLITMCAVELALHKDKSDPMSFAFVKLANFVTTNSDPLFQRAIVDGVYDALRASDGTVRHNALTKLMGKSEADKASMDAVRRIRLDQCQILMQELPTKLVQYFISTHHDKLLDNIQCRVLRKYLIVEYDGKYGMICTRAVFIVFVTHQL